MNRMRWPAWLKHVGRQRKASILQITLLCALVCMVLLWDSVGVDIEFNLYSSSASVDPRVIQRSDLLGPKRNIVSVTEGSVPEIGRAVPPLAEPLAIIDELEQTPKRPADEVVKINATIEVEPTSEELQAMLKTEDLPIEDTKTEPPSEEPQELLKTEDLPKEGPQTEPTSEEPQELLKTEDLPKEGPQTEPTLEEPQPQEVLKTEETSKEDGKTEPTLEELEQELKSPEEETKTGEAVIPKEEKAKRKKKHRKQPKKEEQQQQQQQQLLVNETLPQELNREFTPVSSPIAAAPIPFSLGKTPQNWDQQRQEWLDKNPHLRTSPSGKPRMLLVSGSQPWACKNPVGDHLMLKSMKNKIDYCRQHDIEFFYNFAHLHKEMSSYWAKLPILRSLMLSHPEIEWFFWMDSDAMFTDMLFEIPMDKYQEHNLIMWGYDEGIYTRKSWLAVNNGVFFMRNCQWSLDLLDMWAPMGPSGQVRDEYGKMLTEFLTQRPAMPADDQSALAYLLITKPELRTKVRLEWDYELSGYWADFVEKYEELIVTNHPGLGDKRWPFTTHFTGCQPCSGNNNPFYSAETCALQMERAFNFADNQVLQMMGYQHENLNSGYTRRIRPDSDRPLDFVGSNPWATASESYGL